jgi:putative transposase
MVCIISGFFTTVKGRLFIPLRRDKYFDIQLNRHVFEILDGKKVRSLTITPRSLAFCYSADIEQMPFTKVYGVDRNEKNITFGDRERVTCVGMAEVGKIRQTTGR